MKSYRLLLFSLLLTLQVFLSCSSDDEPAPEVCVPLVAINGLTTYNYEYNESGRLERIEYYETRPEKEDLLTYDSKGRLIKVIRRWIQLDYTYETYELDYNNQGKPATMRSWGQDTSYPPEVTTFSYDTKGRLTIREKTVATFVRSYRYEYDNNDNVTKVFLKGIDINNQDDEVLGRENLSFDTRPRFYAASPELETLNVYVFTYEPSKNNVLSSSVTWINHGTYFSAPTDITYTVGYNEKELVNSLNLSFTPGSFPDFVFYSMEYKCK